MPFRRMVFVYSFQLDAAKVLRAFSEGLCDIARRIVARPIKTKFKIPPFVHSFVHTIGTCFNVR